MTYPDATHPYRIERLNASSSSVTRPNPQTVTYTAYDRPATLAENYLTASFTYNADYQRVKMQTTVQGNIVQKKYYFGGRYEREENSSGTVTAERLFVGGDAYSAPMVLQRTSSSGSWTPYVIGRDYLGSITNIVTTSGTSVATYSYDPWGRMRDPQSLTPYSSTSQPSLLLGRGYCGHEHLSNYGLINMNARLYDPVLGRFLSPDPYVQSPDFSQNFNRYAYALNNPLKYTDESGEYFLVDSWLMGLFCDGLKEANRRLLNDYKIWKGLFQGNQNLNMEERTNELNSRFSSQISQVLLGFLMAHTYNTFGLEGGVQRVDYLDGVTVVQTKNDWTAFTLGNYMVGGCSLKADPSNSLFQHEYGHYLQSQDLGQYYLMLIGIPSLLSKNTPGHWHGNNPTEQDSNIRAFNYFKKYYAPIFDIADSTGEYRGAWNFEDNPINGFDRTNYYNYSNSIVLSNVVVNYALYDVALYNANPFLGTILGGLIHTVINNSKY